MKLYVDINAVLDGDGTQNKPFKTISQAAKVAMPGDEVLVAPGGPENMCEVLERIESRGITKGRAEGRAEGRSEGRVEGISLVAGNLKGYLTDAQIAEIVAKSNAQAQQAE